MGRYRDPEGGYVFEGNLDDVRIYDRALGATEIAGLARGGGVSARGSARRRDHPARPRWRRWRWPRSPAAAGPPALNPPPLDAGWLELRTPHFVISADLDREAAEQAAIELESMFATLSEVGFNAAGQPPRVNISVVHFRREADYQALAPKRTGAFVVTRTGHDFEYRSRVVLHGELLARSRATMLHELAHVFVGHYYPQAPIWLNEGLAEYLSTVAQEDGFTVIGRPGDSRFHRGLYRVDCQSGGCSVLVPVGDARPIKDLVAMTADQFYGDLDDRAAPVRPGRRSVGPPSATGPLPAASSVSCSRTRTIA